MHEFIYAVGVVMVIGVLWVGWELYRIRQQFEARNAAYKPVNVFIDQGEPQLFDQEAK